MTTPTASITVSPNAMFRELDGEAVLLNTKTGKYFGLDETGTRMWNLLTEHGGAEDVRNRLLAEYDATPEQLEHDLREFVNRLAFHGLVETHAQTKK